MRPSIRLTIPLDEAQALLEAGRIARDRCVSKYHQTEDERLTIAARFAFLTREKLERAERRITRALERLS